MKNEFKVVPHFHQIADTGDYDGCYEITNGDISFFTKDDLEEDETFVKALNESGCEFYSEDSVEFELQLEKKRADNLSKLCYLANIPQNVIDMFSVCNPNENDIKWAKAKISELQK